jgi:hypothetical protein
MQTALRSLYTALTPMRRQQKQRRAEAIAQRSAAPALSFTPTKVSVAHHQSLRRRAQRFRAAGLALCRLEMPAAAALRSWTNRL